MLVPHLAAKRIRAAESFVAMTADDLLDRGIAQGRIEWMGAVANRLPMMVVARLIGVPDHDVDMLIASGYATTQLLDGLVSAEQLTAAGTAAIELSGYISEHFERAATEPGDNLLGDLATLCAAGQLDDNTARIVMLTLFSAGGESTASLLGSAMWLLADQPDIQRQLRRKPELLAAFIEEALRFEPLFADTIATSCPIHRSVVSPCLVDRACCCSGARSIAIRHSSNIRTSSASTVRRARGT